MKQFLLLTLSILVALSALAQSASLHPSKLYFDAALGETQSQVVHVSNNGTEPQTFQFAFMSFSSPGKKGKTRLGIADPGTSCAKWLSAEPSEFRLEPGETREVEIKLSVPSDSMAETVRWAVASIKLNVLSARDSLQTDQQVKQSFFLVMHIFQTPPSFTKEAVKIVSAKPTELRAKSFVEVEVENEGETLVNCSIQITLFNTRLGEEFLIKSKRPFTILPKGIRISALDLPNDLPSGKYKVITKVITGSKEVILETDYEHVE